MREWAQVLVWADELAEDGYRDPRVEVADTASC